MERNNISWHFSFLFSIFPCILICGLLSKKISFMKSSIYYLQFKQTLFPMSPNQCQCAELALQNKTFFFYIETFHNYFLCLTFNMCFTWLILFSLLSVWSPLSFLTLETISLWRIWIKNELLLSVNTMINCSPQTCSSARPSGVKAFSYFEFASPKKVIKLETFYWVGKDYRKVIRLLLSYFLQVKLWF